MAVDVSQVDPVPSDHAPRNRLALHWWILIGLLIGATGGLIASRAFPAGEPHDNLLWYTNNVAKPVGKIFLRLIFMVVIPLVFCAIAGGVAGLGELRRLGRVGGLSLLYTVILSTISVLLAIGLVNAIQPGKQISVAKQAELRERFSGEAGKYVASARKSKTATDAILDIIPTNPLQEMVGAMDGSSPGGGMLAVMFFALAFGAALLAGGQKAAPVLAVMDGVFDACMRIIGFAMFLAPIGVAALMFAMTAELGLDVLRVLLAFFLTGLLGLSLHFFGVYSLFLALAARMNPLIFFARISEVIFTALGTSSSNATLPTALRVAEQRLGLRKHISNFVLTVGATANQNGTALYEGVVVLFLAQVFGVDLSLGQQVTVALMCILGGIGTAGVPGGSLPYIAIVLQSVNVPPESIALILGVDRLLDMCRTVVNVGGDLAIAAAVDRSVGT
jgi:DAACS family dicarboxylate/amino acid:cation (Na+ or H+) symporter